MKHIHYPEKEGVDARALGLDGAENMMVKRLSDDVVVLELAPGGCTPYHTHRDRERLIIMSGQGEIRLDGVTAPVRTDDFVEFEGNEMHQVNNSGHALLVIACFRNQ
jgi:quercetin dioxygenase-like cupin family protein